MTSAGLTAQAVADLVGGRLLGDGTVVVRGVRALDRAGPDTLSLAVSSRYADDLRASKAGAVLVPDALAQPPAVGARIVVPDPYAALVRVIGVLLPRSAGTQMPNRRYALPLQQALTACALSFRMRRVLPTRAVGKLNTAPSPIWGTIFFEPMRLA